MSDTLTFTARDTEDGRKLCDGESKLYELLDLAADDKLFCYVSDLGTQVRDFTGKLVLGRITQKRIYKRNLSWLSNEFWYVRVTDIWGCEWYGTSPGRGMYCKLRRAKRQKGR